MIPAALGAKRNAMAANGWERADVRERPDYVPASPAEAFVVPLLRKRILRCLGQFARPGGSPGRALDVGCGRQPFRGQLESNGYRYCSLDAVQNPEGTVDFLAPIDGALPPNLTAELPFDLVLCTEVLEHVADWQAAFANLRSLTAVGGAVVVTCPQVYMLHEEPHDFWRPTNHALRYFAERHGFRIHTLERLGGPREVLGTVLGSCTFRSSRPGLFRMLGARTLNLVKRLTLAFLRSRLSQGSVELCGPTYLSNFAVLIRQAPVGGPPL